MKDCPCGTEFPYTDCCGPLIRGVGHADTAEDLMRARFTAFALGHFEYLEKSLHPDECIDAQGLVDQQSGVRWKRLEILESKNGGPFDKEGEVSFVAHFTKNGEQRTLQERSKFLKVKGYWYYSHRMSQVKSRVDNTSGKPFQRQKSKVGRNEKCPCDSGKKFKKCCGK